MGRKAVFWLVLLAINFGLGFRYEEGSQAESKSRRLAKISPDLTYRLRRDDRDKRVSVIIQTRPTSERGLDDHLKGLGGRTKRKLQKLNLRVVDIPLAAIESVAGMSDVVYVSLDRPATSFGHLAVTTGTEAVRIQSTIQPGGFVATTTVLDGSNVGIAIIDSGIDADHEMFRNGMGLSRVIVNQDFTGENRTDDAFGHGTHVASIAAGNDTNSNGAYTGIASNANLINLRVLNAQGLGTTSSLLTALDWVLTNRSVYGIRVVNMSIGTPAIDSYLNDPLCQAVRAVADSGIVVIAAAGNNGKTANGQKIYGQIHSPGNEPSVITVGASNSFGTDVRSDDSVTSYSSRGPTRSFWTDENGARRYDNLLKPDLVAPGNKIISAAARDNLLLTQHPELDANVSNVAGRRMMYLSGSSMAAPIAAGAAALLLQLNPDLTPSLIKAMFTYTAQPLAGMNNLEQGAGELNVEGTVRLARGVRTDLSSLTPLGAPLLTADAPVQTTTLSNESFTWAGGLILNHTYVKGPNLITKYQKVYGYGWILGDGVIEGPGGQTINLTRLTGGLVLGDAIVISNGTQLGDGPVFLDLNLLLSGIMLGDGIMVGDGILVGDGVMVGDGIMVGDSCLQPLSILTSGDNSSGMQ
jgi:serine protease AprX